MPGPQGKQSQWVKNLFPAFFLYAHVKIILIFKFCDYKSFNIFIIRRNTSSLSELGFFKSVNGVYLDVIGKWPVFSLSDHAITMVFGTASAQ